MGAEPVRGGKLMAAPSTLGGCQGFHGNDSNNLFQGGHACLKLFQRVFLHTAHSGGTSRGSNEFWFIATAQNGTNRFVNCQQLIDSDSALVPRVVANGAAFRPGDAVR